MEKPLRRFSKLVFRFNKEVIVALVLAILLIVLSVSSSNKGVSTPEKYTDLKSILSHVSSPAYAASVDYFLKVDGIPGESQDQQHKDEIQLLSWSWGSTQAALSRGGTHEGKPNLQNFSFTMNVNKASPKLFLACADGHRLKDALLSVRKIGGPQIDFLKITFSDLLCKSYNEKGDPQDLIPVDQISLNFTKIKIEYIQLGADGKPVAPPITESWDFEKNK